MNIEKGNRKTWVFAIGSILGLIVFVLLAILSYTKGHDAPQLGAWSTYQITITGFFMGANYGEHAMNREKK